MFDSQAFIILAYENTNISFDNVGGMIAFSFVVYVSVYFVVVYVIMNTILKPRISKNGNLSFKSPVIICFIGFALVADIIISDIFRYEEKVSNSIQIIYILISILLCVSLLCLQMSMIKTKDIEQEMEIISRLYDEQQKHFKIRKETIDLINIKCHDMKHKIRLLTNGKNFSNEEIESIDKSITIYDSSLKTGNEALDVILTEKAFICNEKNVKFTCVIDGTLISFINETDIFSLFGNIMDNALNATLKMDNIDERFINLKINKEKDFISINIKNSFKCKINLDKDGLPITDNIDKNYHGFGMKSISYMVEKYHGNLSIAINDNIFNLNILFLNKTA